MLDFHFLPSWEKLSVFGVGVVAATQPNHWEEEEEERASSIQGRAIHFSRVPPGKLFAYRHTEDAHTVQITHTHTEYQWRVKQTLDQFSFQRKKNKPPAGCEQAFKLAVSARSTRANKRANTAPPPHIDQ